MATSSEKFWLESPKSLFSQMKIVPKENMKLAEQMNALTRLVFILFLVLNLMGFKDAMLFLFLSVIFIIILYYIQKGQMTTCENYEPEQVLASKILPKPVTPYQPSTFTKCDIPISQSDLAHQNYIAKTNHLYKQFADQPRVNLVNHPSYYNQQVAKEVEINPDQTYVSNNQKLVGGPNPKTKVKPVVVPPAYEWTCWKANDFVVPSQINTRSVQDYYASGYYVDEAPVEMTPQMKSMASQPSCSGFPSDPPMRSLPSFPEAKRGPQRIVAQNKPDIVENYANSENYEEVEPMDHANYYYRFGQRGSGTSDPCRNDICSYKNGGITPLDKDNGDFYKLVKRDELFKSTGDLDDALGYDPSNIDFGLPSNYPAANCQLTKQMRPLNEQMFTSTVVPGIYYKSQIIEPISSNIGISFDQQIPAREVTKDKYGNMIYEAKDPRQYKPNAPQPKAQYNVPSTYDVYDPRYDGYGTAERSYTDKMTGQPRFYYDDVDAIRRPNYVTRSEIDTLCGADTYGPIVSSEEEKKINARIRVTADQSYTDNTLDFRTDMMTRLMRKRNAELWQTRMAPKTTMKK